MVKQFEGTNSRRVEVAFLAAVVFGLLLYFASINRPIWIDEFLHFTFGAYPGIRQAYAVIRESIGTLNFGQTGVFLMMDYLALHFVGANAFLMRLPSLFGGILLMAGAVNLLRSRGFNVFWQLSVILLLTSEYLVIHFVGDARPYMPLAGSVVGILSYYAAADKNRRGWVSVIGWTSAIYGALMHPYFGLYMSFVAVGTFVDRPIRLPAKRLVWDVLEHVNVKMVAASAFVFFLVGYKSWMGRVPAMSFDPFEHIAANDLVATFFSAHLQFLPTGSQWWGCLLPLFILIVVSGARPSRRWIAPAVFIFGALLISAFLSYQSYRSHYWIVQRQWIASIALCIVGTVWLLAEVSRSMDRMSRVGIVTFVFVVSALGSFNEGVAQWGRIQQWSVEQQELKSSLAALSPDARTTPRVYPLPLLEWVRLGAQNIAEGGPVWPIFRKFYSGPDA